MKRCSIATPWDEPPHNPRRRCALPAHHDGPHSLLMPTGVRYDEEEGAIVPGQTLGEAARDKHGAAGCSPCVLDVLCGAFPWPDAIALAWECTCFPMSCEIAVEQARAIVRDDGMEGAMAL